MICANEYKALVVEDDPKSVEKILDALASLEHVYDVVQSQEEALKRLKTGDYSYLLCAMGIRVRSGQGEARVQNTENLLEKMSLMDGRTKPPVIILSDHVASDLDKSVDLMRLAISMSRRGVVDVIAKPCPGEGRTLDRVIKKVLGLNGHGSPPSRPRKSGRGLQAPAAVARIGRASRPVAATPIPAAAARPSTPAPAPEAKAPQAAPGDAEPACPPTLTKMQRQVLDALAGSPHQTMLQVELVAAGGYSKHATCRCLRRLGELGLVHRPQGERAGYAATSTGRKLLAG